MQTVKGIDGNVYIPFFQPRYVFSNFYPCERLIIDGIYRLKLRRKFRISGIHFRNTEQYFAYQKALFAKDMATAEKILQTSDPVHAMTLSREIKNFDSQRWDKISYEVGEQCQPYSGEYNFNNFCLMNCQMINSTK